MTDAFSGVGSNITSEPDRFGRAFLVAAVIELAAILFVATRPMPPPAAAPAVVKLQMIQPAPQPVAKPPPPKPPPPVPTPPQPVTPPVPVPPPPPPHHSVVRHIQRVVHTPPPPPTPPPPLPEPPAPVSAAPPPAPVVNEDAMTRYAAAIHSIVYGNLQVPDQIVESGLSGNCTLQFTVAPDGTVLDVEVIDPAGLASVNQAALDALRGSRLPPFTAGMPAGPHVFTMVVHVDANGGDQ